MSTITQAQYADMLARTQRNSGRMPTEPEIVEQESDLHDEIIRICKCRGWFYVHSRMDKRTTQAVGVPDFIIAADNSETYWIECKRKGSKPTPEQLATICHLRHNGHIAGIVTNMAEFWQLVTGNDKLTDAATKGK